MDLLLGMTRRQRSARVPRIGGLRVMRIPALLALAFALCAVSPASAQEHRSTSSRNLGRVFLPALFGHQLQRVEGYAGRERDFLAGNSS